MVLSEAVSSPFISLLDSTVLTMLGEARRPLYGRQRLWGAIGWGLCSLAVGAVRELLHAVDGDERCWDSCFWL